MSIAVANRILCAFFNVQDAVGISCGASGTYLSTDKLMAIFAPPGLQSVSRDQCCKSWWTDQCGFGTSFL